MNGRAAVCQTESQELSTITISTYVFLLNYVFTQTNGYFQLEYNICVYLCILFLFVCTRHKRLPYLFKHSMKQYDVNLPYKYTPTNTLECQIC